MDEETLFKTVYIATHLVMDGRVPDTSELSYGRSLDGPAGAVGKADKAWDRLQEFRVTVSQFVEIESTNPSGEPAWCGLCDSAHCTGHPQLRCERCGTKGLAENMTAERHTCRVDRIQQEPWLAFSGPCPCGKGALGHEGPCLE